MRRTIGVIIGAALMLSSVACSAPEQEAFTEDEGDSISVIETINSASVIRAKKKVISWGDSWTIYADGEEVGNVKGVPIYLVGDTYSLFSKDGNLVGSESENFKVLNSTADIYDYNGNKTGHISQKIVTLLLKFSLYDGETQVGSAEQNLSFKMKADIKGSTGKEEWNVSRKIMAIGADVTVTKAENTGDDVSGMDALWMALMMNEIYEAQQEKSNNDN